MALTPPFNQLFRKVIAKITEERLKLGIFTSCQCSFNRRLLTFN